MLKSLEVIATTEPTALSTDILGHVLEECQARLRTLLLDFTRQKLS